MLRETKIEVMPAQSADVGIGQFIARERPQLISRFRHFLKYLGPAFIVSVAYIDPGNFATNISGGSKFNYNLVWVILWSNLMAIFLQSLSAKLGIATGASLPDMCARIFSRRANWFFWIAAVIAAIATELAEVLGAALGLYLLFGIPLVYAGLISGVLIFAIILLEKYGQRIVEIVIAGLVAVISAAYAIELFLAKPDWAQVGLHTLIPSLPNGEAVLIAVGMLGATVMPHVIYLHSQLVQCRNKNQTDQQKLKHYKMEKLDIVLAMNIAFLVNAAMVVVSASVFFTQGLGVESIEQAHQSLTPLLGALSSGAFGIALLASGLSSSAVGTLAGQTIMQGFVNLNIPLTVRRLVTILPAMIIITMGINPIKALIASQVVLSFTLPLAIIPLMLITRRKSIMGPLVNRPLTNIAGWIITSLVVSLNGVLIYLTLTGKA